jgi:hypothetical protein
LIKCRSNYQGQTLGERVSKVHRAAKEWIKMEANNESLETNSTVASFLKSATTSCKVLGHTAEAMKDAMKKLYVLRDYFRPHLLMMNDISEHKGMTTKGEK